MEFDIVRCSNSVVTDYYLDILGRACAKVNSKSRVTITARYRDAVMAKMRGKKVIFWSQGVGPEEYAMRHDNRIKLLFVNIIAYLALRSSDFIVFVSKAMKDHYEKKYKISFSEKRYYIMPCYNTSLREEAFIEKDKYSNNTFVYTGSMEKWQGVPHIIECYKRIEESGLPNTKLEIYTAEQETAAKLVKEAGLANYYIGCCSNDELQIVLGHIKYGFILREDNIVNRVSTPTKISTYLANGVIPIYSKCIASFHDVASKMKYVVEEKETEKKILAFDEEIIKAECVLEEYRRVFDTYYSNEYHISNLTERLTIIFK